MKMKISSVKVGGEGKRVSGRFSLETSWPKQARLKVVYHYNYSPNSHNRDLHPDKAQGQAKEWMADQSFLTFVFGSASEANPSCTQTKESAKKSNI